MIRKAILLVIMCASTMAMQAQKFALVDMEYILKNIPAYERANEQLNQVSKKWQAEVEAVQIEAQTLYKNYQNEVVFLSQEQKKTRQEAIVKKEQEAAELIKKIAGEFSPIPVHISHIGIFAPGKVLFGGLERNTELDLLHNACDTNPDPQRPWTPHVTMLIDEPATICKALPLFLESFDPFVGLVTRLHLCAFWPTREILSIKLNRAR